MNSARIETFERFAEKTDLKVIKVAGKYGYDETRYIVLDISEYNAIAIGKTFEQEAVLVPRGLVTLVYDQGFSGPATIQRLLWSDVLREDANDFYTELPDGTRFSFTLGAEEPYTAEVREALTV